MTICKKSILYSALIAILALSTNATNLKISNINDGIAGVTHTFSVSVDSLDSDINGYNIVLALNQNFYGFISVAPSQEISDCGWEYFNYRLYHKDSLYNFDIGKNTNLLSVTGMKGLSGMDFPSCGNSATSGTLLDLRLKFIHSFRNLSCHSLPISFYWRDCNDNILYSSGSDTITYISALYEHSFDTILSDHSFPGFGPPNIDCNSEGSGTYNSNIVATNGYIDFPCTDSIGGGAGDVNLNEIPMETADAVLFSSYFKIGLMVFLGNLSAQIYQTDINSDGLALSVADFVLLIRIIIGDEEPPYSKLLPTDNFYNENPVMLKLNEQNGLTTIELESNSNIAAVYLRLTNKNNEMVDLSKIQNENDKMKIGSIGNETTFFLSDMADNLVLESGKHELLTLEGTGYKITHVEIVDEFANNLVVNKTEPSIPSSFRLNQNYPNPFNPTTNISFFMAKQSDWKLTIYNMTGQIVRQFIGESIGKTSIEWDGTNSSSQNVSSGIYFYKLESDISTDTKKMILLK